jgi:hypothetical protein
MMLRNIAKTKWFSPLFIFFFTLICFGIYIPRLGLFGDDWIYLYSYHVAGSSGYPAFVSFDRPYSAWIYQLTSSLFAERVWMYHTYLFLLRWFSGVLCWLILDKIWPKQKRQTLAIATLFSIFPAFLQQAISLEFILHFTILDLVLLSIYLMILAIEQPKYKYWYLVPAVLLTASHFSIEYFVGLEIVRPVLIYVFLHREIKKHQTLKLLDVFKTWLPYLVMDLAFAIWRVFIFKFPSYEPHFVEKFSENPASALSGLAARIWSDIQIVFVKSWTQIFTPPAEKVSKVFWLLVLAALAASVIVFYLLKRSKEEKHPLKLKWNQWPVVAILCGLFLFVISGWPFWITEVPLELSFPWDRTILSFMLASAFVLVGVVDLLFRPKFQALVLAVVIAFSVAFHYFNARVYEKEHAAIQNYFWQLSWRIPELKTGTILLTQDLPLWRESDNDLVGTLNWMFAPQSRSNKVPYFLFDFTSRDQSILPVIEPDIPVVDGTRSLLFDGNTSDILSAYWNGSDCVWLLLNGEVQPSGMPDPLKQYTVLSEEDQILTNSNTERAAPDVLAEEPAHQWCYYYQKAALANQMEDWQEVIRQADEAESNGYDANNAYEYFPFLEAYLMNGSFESAFELSEKIQNRAGYTTVICDLWNKAFLESESQVSESFEQDVQTTFKCNP